jgi:hypothetical protein
MSDPRLDALIAKWPSLSPGQREAIFFLAMSSIEPGSKAWGELGGAQSEDAAKAIVQRL